MDGADMKHPVRNMSGLKGGFDEQIEENKGGVDDRNASKEGFDEKIGEMQQVRDVENSIADAR